MKALCAVALIAGTVGLVASAPQAPAAPQTPPASRRSQRVHMEEVRVTSPNRRITFTLLPNAERLTYRVTIDNTTVIEPSPIVMTVDGYDLSTGVVLKGQQARHGDDTYPWWGAHSIATDRYNGVDVALTNDLTSIDYTLEIRAYDDGVAFRHVIAGTNNAARVPDEQSAFNLPAGAAVWYAGMAEGHYEAPYLKKDISDVQPGEWAGPPLTMKLPQGAGYASITEANLVKYSGMGLEADGRRGWVVGLGHRQPLNYPFELRYGRAEGKRLGQAASVTGTIATPWRVVMVGRDLNTLVNSTIVSNLCPPPDPAMFPDGLRTAWLKPGRAVWRYLDGGPTGATGVKEFSRLAGELGFEHQVVEGFWSGWSPTDRRDVVDYSRQQNVSLWFWKHSNQLRTPQAQDDFFKTLRDAGAVGAKIDFFDHEAKEIIDLYETLLRKAAENHVMLVFHGANKPTGRARTWPNEMVREAVRGMESSGMMERARHETILPFTRELAGPADYTAMLFTERRRDTTSAHQIASAAIFSAPLLTIAANPQSLVSSPAADVIKSIPAVWDETIVLPESEIGELAGFARRSGTMWMVAVMAGPATRTLTIPLSFLGDGAYRVTTVSDVSSDSSAVKVESMTHRRSDTIRLELQSGGGFIARFQK